MKIKSLKLVGQKQVWNLGVKHPVHNYVLDVGVVSKNSHALSYSILSYRTAYLKRHHSAHFYAALMSNEDALDDIRPFINGAKKNGLTILCPDVNQSCFGFTVIDDWNIRFGLGAVRGCGESAVSDILREREGGLFKSLQDFCSRVDPSSTKKNNLVALAYGGAFDVLQSDMNRLEIATYIVDVAASLKRDQQARKIQQLDMFGELFSSDDRGLVVMKPKMAFDSLSLLEEEKKVLGLYLSDSPLRRYDVLKQLRHIDDIASLELPDLYVSVLCRVVDVQVRSNLKGSFAFLTLEDDSGVIEAKMWSNIFSKFGHLMEPGVNVLISGKTNLYRGLDINVDHVSLAETEIKRVTQPVILKKLSDKLVYRITKSEQGDVPVDLEIAGFRFRLGRFNLTPSISDWSC